MFIKGEIQGEFVTLSPFETAQISNDHLQWLRDPEVVRFLEVRHNPVTLVSISEYVEGVLNSDHSYLFRILEAATRKYIGNLKLGPIDRNNLVAELGIMLGDKSVWGKGYGADSLISVSRFAFRQLGLRKLVAGVNELNLGSIRLFEKSGFLVEGVSASHLQTDPNTRSSLVTFGMTPGQLEGLPRQGG
jgi:ribosomal-protein-alanine N-acetyltransferase